MNRREHGRVGLTAHAGLLTIGRPEPRATVVVASASGAVGSVAGQIARITGARAVGIADGPEKCAYVRNELGFDNARSEWPGRTSRATKPLRDNRRRT